MNKHKQHGFAGLHLLLILIVVAVIGAVGWYVYYNNSKSNKNLNSTIDTSNNTTNASKKTGSNIIPNSTSSTTAPIATTTPQPSPTYGAYMNISEWGVKVPTNSQYMGYRWDITDSKDNLVSVFITDDTEGLSKNVGCSAGDIQGLYVYKDAQLGDYSSESNSFMPDANLNVGGHTYYVYKSVCQGKVSPSVESLAKKIDLMSPK